jgi:hypothetical protein
MDWRLYEHGLLERFRYEFRAPLFSVHGTSADGRPHRVRGRYSLVERQLDAAVYQDGESAPILVADAKHRTRLICVAVVEAFIGMLDDVGCRAGILVAPNGFTEGAQRRAAGAEVHVEVMSQDAALTFNYYQLAREVYPFDWIFRPDLARALRALEEGTLAAAIAETLEDVAFEEWEAFASYAIANYRSEAVSLLVFIASEHHDEGWRYNAVRLLLDTGHLPLNLRNRLLQVQDPELQELLAES